MKAIFVIDPGVSGGAYTRDADGREVLYSWLGRLDAANLVSAIYTDTRGEYQVFIERVHGSPVQGASSAFKFGQNYGEWLGILQAHRYHPIGITPQCWQRVYAPLIDNVQGPKRKSALNKLAKNMAPFGAPKATLSTCDALLMGRYIADCLDNNKPHGGTPV